MEKGPFHVKRAFSVSWSAQEALSGPRTALSLPKHPDDPGIEWFHVKLRGSAPPG